MKTHKLFVPALFATLFLQAQDAPSHQLKIGVSGSVDYGSYLLYIDNQYQQGMWFTEQPAFGYSTGLHGACALNPHWSFNAGLRFTEHNCSTNWISLTQQNGTQLGMAHFIYHMRYIDIPLGIQYNTSEEKRISFISGVNITPGYALGEWTELNYEGSNEAGISDSQHKSDITDFNNFSLKAEAYAGIGINMKQFQLQILPEFRMSLLKASGSAYVNRQYWSTGIEFRLLYNL